MFKKVSLLISFIILGSTPAIANPLNGDAEAGKIKAFSCQFCHGANGVASQPNYPHLNGQNELYLFNAMKAYQDNKRSGIYAEMMKKQLSMMKEQDLADIAAFYTRMDN
ncbi:cytochrome c [Photobacterium sp. SDRW27]|uniref:c-type cytochrome n=1 Tax=Photobacterium obscurum TaxID=2829490 RepID=UPI00224416C4|nr:cytochrome c [Photobacterium obscurum]MCW8329747.1 cytochrome c [Photobacterium obscurum]